MRLQLILLLVAPARAGDSATTRVDVYDDGYVRVIAPSARAVIDREKVRVDGGWTVDVVSGATPGLGVDVVSTATPFDETRQQADLALTVRPEPVRSVRLGYTTSRESDYATHTPSATLSWELLDRTATVSARYGASFERAWVSQGDPIDERSLVHGIDLGWTQILDPKTTAAVAVAGGWASCGELLGCQASPYRWVPITDGGAHALALRERHPSERGSLSGSLKLSRSLGPVGLHVEGRGYADTWGVIGHTERAAAAVEALDEHLLLRVEARNHAQSEAVFFREAYVDKEALPGWRTADAELAGVRDHALGGRAEWSFYGVGPLVRLGVSGRVNRLWYTYPSLADRPRRDAWIVGGGLDAEF